MPQSDLDDLQRRLVQTRWPEDETIPDTSQGPQLAKIRNLVDHWINAYDWRRTGELLNVWGQFVTTIDGVEIYFLHVR